MSRLPGAAVNCSSECPAAMDVIILPRSVDIGGFKVHRALPCDTRRMVGPFIFWDRMGPGKFAAGQGVDVRPHPHIGLSTVTYLFDGSLDHRDSLGNNLRIVPGEVNLMRAGSGIVHSERTGLDIRRNPSRLSGIQSWMAQPQSCEECDPGFTHVGLQEIPMFESKKISGRLVLGDFQGLRSPIETQWETIYLELKIKKGGILKVPTEPEERALFLLSGTIEVAGTNYDQCQMMVLRPGAEISIQACENTHLIVLGGAVMDSPRYIWWNFVSSSVDRIRSAAADWQNERFASVPGDEKERIPLPDIPFPEV